MVQAGRKPERFARIWLHTHPGGSPQPSATDEETFARVFGSCQWALMFVLARGGKTYARMRFNVGPGGNIVIPVEVDFAASFGPSRRDAWEAEYKANINAAASRSCVKYLLDWPCLRGAKAAGEVGALSAAIIEQDGPIRPRASF